MLVPVQIADSNGKVLALLCGHYMYGKGTNFLTTPEIELQVGILTHKKNHKIKAHRHTRITRKVSCTEVLIVIDGLIRAFIFDDNNCLVTQFSIVTGDILILLAGGHAFTMLEDSTIIEVKQGPYVDDKVMIEPKEN